MCVHTSQRTLALVLFVGMALGKIFPSSPRCCMESDVDNAIKMIKIEVGSGFPPGVVFAKDRATLLKYIFIFNHATGVDPGDTKAADLDWKAPRFLPVFS